MVLYKKLWLYHEVVISHDILPALSAYAILAVNNRQK